MNSEKKGEITISCQRSKMRTGHVEACIAQLPWEFLSYLALSGKLILNLKSCSDCPHTDCLELLEVQYEGSRRMAAADFLRGHPMKTGERLQ